MTSKPNELPEGMQHNWDIKSWTERDIKNRLTEVLEIIRNLYDRAGTADMADLSFETLLQPLLKVQRLTFGHHWWHGTLGTPIVFPKLVSTSKEVRDAASEAGKEIDKLTLEMFSRKDIFQRLVEYKKTCDLDPEYMRFVDRMLTTGRRCGIQLEDEHRIPFLRVMNDINSLASEFEQNVIEDNCSVLLNADELDGLPDNFIKELKVDQETGLRTISIRSTCYLTLMQMCRNPKTRRKAFIAFENVGGGRNEEIMQEVIGKRQNCAYFLDYPNWAAYRQEILIAKNQETVNFFLNNLVSKIQPLWEAEQDALLKLKEDECNKYGYEFNGELYMWDIDYYANMFEEREYGINRDMVKEYFPLETVTNGMLGIYSHILGLNFTKLKDPPTWHEDVFAYKVSDKESGELMGYVYMDLYPRSGKFPHFATLPLQSGALNENGIKEKVVVCIVCNFTPPSEDKPSLLTPSEVKIFFHEFGHAMHVTCSKSKVQMFWGIHVENDFVEAPSQMLENWCEKKEVLARMSGHYKTGERIPDDLVDKINTRKANAAFDILSQISFAIFDQEIHKNGHVVPRIVFDDTFRETIGIMPSEDTFVPGRFVHAMKSFDAAYYSYLWSLVCSIDMYETVFGGVGPLDANAGMTYRKTILEKGGSVDALDMLREFLGREPNCEAFLRSKGLL